MNLLNIGHLVTFLVTSTLGIFVLVRKYRTPSAWFFFVFAMSTALWNFSLFMAISMYGQPTFWGRLAISFGSFMPAGFMLLLTEFPWRNPRFFLKRILILIPALFFFFFSLTSHVVKEAWIVNRSHIRGDLGVGYEVFWIYYLLLLVIAFSLAIAKLKKTVDLPKRNQMRWVLAGCVSFFTPLVITQFVLPQFGIFSYNNLGPLFSIPMVACISYAIIRHQFLDIRFVVQRGLVYTLFISLVIALYTTTLQFLSHLFTATKTPTILSAGVIMVFGIFAWQPLRTYLQKITDPIFFRHGYIYEEALKKLSYILQTELSREAIIESASRELEYIFKSRFVHIISSSNEPTREHIPHSELSFPITLYGATIATIKLGEKLSGEEYSDRDKQLLETFALQASVALEKGRLFQQVQEHTNHLEKLVAERTKEVRDLHEEQKRAIVDISHNLQTPLTIIEGELQLFPQQSAHISVVRESIQRVSAFIRQLLRLARFDSSTFTIEFQQFDIAQTIREQAEYFDVVAQESQIRITTKTPTTVIIFGNKRLIEELLTNLVSNAITYRDTAKQSSITISLAETAHSVQVCVSDNGIGIPREDIPSLFTRFYRSSRTKESLPGSGLGLAIVKGIAERHGGSVSVESLLGHGSTFTITLPKHAKVL